MQSFYAMICVIREETSHILEVNMEEKINAPAFLFYKSNFDIIQDYTNEERGKLFTALFIYAQTKELPLDFPRDLLTCFKLLKSDIDRNEERYRQKAKSKKGRNDRYQAKQKATPPEPAEAPPEDKPPDSETKPTKKQTSPKGAKNEPKQDNLTKEQAQFFESFKKHFPDKAIDCKISEMPKVDYSALMLEMKRSPQFLQKCSNLTLKWCLENADKIIKGNYRLHEDAKPPDFSTSRSYTREEMNSLFQNVEDIEI